jgi:protein CpxP
MRRPLLLLALAAGLAAQSPAPSPAPEAPQARRTRRQERVAKALALSEAQKGQIKQIRDKHREALKAKHAAVRDARKQLHQAMQDPKTSETELRKRHRQMADLRFGLLLEMRAMRQEVGAVLTPEQREKAAELRGRVLERGRMMRGFAG